MVDNLPSLLLLSISVSKLCLSSTLVRATLLVSWTWLPIHCWFNQAWVWSLVHEGSCLTVGTRLQEVYASSIRSCFVTWLFRTASVVAACLFRFSYLTTRLFLMLFRFWLSSALNTSQCRYCFCLVGCWSLIGVGLASITSFCLICCNTTSPIRALTKKFLSLGWGQFLCLLMYTVAIRCLTNLLICSWLVVESNLLVWS